MSDLVLEILDDAHVTAVVSDGSSSGTIELQVQQDATVHSLTVQEFIEIAEQGPAGNPATTSALLFIPYNGSSYPVRTSVTADLTRPVVWIGPVSPTIGGDFALDNIDHWWNTAG